MPRYVKKPVAIDAAPVSALVEAAENNWSALPDWVVAGYEKGDLIFLPRSIEVNSDCGWVTAELHDMLMRGVKGELYPCRRDVFAETYEPAAE